MDVDWSRAFLIFATTGVLVAFLELVRNYLMSWIAHRRGDLTLKITVANNELTIKFDDELSEKQVHDLADMLTGESADSPKHTADLDAALNNSCKKADQ